MGDRLAIALEKHAWLRATLLNFVLLGTCALIGDGILTPAISGTCQLHDARAAATLKLLWPDSISARSKYRTAWGIFSSVRRHDIARATAS